ncbi:MAG: hypothetical protein JXA20_08840 [Spirochaetes bacterium]|nr:hypothetical protein [Spirochaetota bacterium]
MESTYFALASKSSFNKALRHFFAVNDAVDEVESKRNLADVVNGALDSGDINSDQILPIVGAIIRDKFGYSYDSYTLTNNLSEFNKIVEETIKWTALDIVLVYFNPSGEILLINPKNINHWERARELMIDQLVVVYAKFLKEDSKKIEKEAIETIEEMISGKDVFSNKAFIDQTVVPKAPAAPAPAAHAAPGAAPAMPTGKKKMTQKYGVQVSNELFHNGNVEAWKKIVESFKVKFPDLDVYIYFEGELINDINALFKWGKVKHGDSIFFQVAGEEIRGVSKLQKYLHEGASPRFEQFLKIGVGRTLNLF